MMFKVMSYTEKESPHVLLFGKQIKKPIFVISCVVMAFWLFSFVSI
jgi:hypothetical protein